MFGWNSLKAAGIYSERSSHCVDDVERVVREWANDNGLTAFVDRMHRAITLTVRPGSKGPGPNWLWDSKGTAN